MGTQLSSLAAADFNNDGKLDLVISESYDYGFHFLAGKGDGTFSDAQDFVVGGGAFSFSITVGDFNGDGHLDLSTAGGNIVSILLGQGDGTFGDAQEFAVGEFPRSVTVGDFNCDGYQDLAAANAGASSVSVLLGQGDGTFATAQDFDVGQFPGAFT